MRDINEIRKDINNIDDQICKLFTDRMNLSREVAEYKMAKKNLVTDTRREDEIVYRLSEKTPDEYKYYLKELYYTIFSVSKAYQIKLMQTTSKTTEKIKKALESEKKEFPISATVACQGVEGANSGIAAKKVFSISNISYFKNFEGVFTAVDKGFCEFGVLPIENSTAGSVLEVYDLMKKYNTYIVKSVRVKINHCLVVNVGVEKKDIKKIISHSQALSQCANYISKLKVESESVENTAVAGKRIAESGDKTTACICSKECAEIYGLKILEENIEDNPLNYTRFIVISKNLNIYEDSDRISVMLSAPHESGSLSKILAKFSALNLSLTKLESRPIVGGDFEFLFYFDFIGSVKNQGVINLISELENKSQRFEFLGCYKEII